MMTLCNTSTRPLFWGMSMILLSLVSVFAEFDGPYFWMLFFVFLTFAVSDMKRGAKGC